MPRAQHQTPTTKHQRKTKSQTRTRGRWFEVWSLEVFWCLVFGVWCFSSEVTLVLQLFQKVTFVNDQPHARGQRAQAVHQIAHRPVRRAIVAQHPHAEAE